uniref:Uncharacterized protein n=1 Tax=Sphaerodactylus townsendi TaxID=933632 RepID=A0ACB8FTI4_9SAUR
METMAGGYGWDRIGHSSGCRDSWLGPLAPPGAGRQGKSATSGPAIDGDCNSSMVKTARQRGGINPSAPATAPVGASGAAAGAAPTGRDPAPVGPAPPAPIQRRRREPKAMFNRDPENLPYFLVQVGAYMRMMDDEYATDAERVYDIGILLEGEATAWLAGLFEEESPELRDLDRFMVSLCRRFEDPFPEEKARVRLQCLR